MARAADKASLRKKKVLGCNGLRGCERLEDRCLMALLPYGALPDDTGEYMLGDIAVTVVFMESDRTVAPPGTTPDFDTETWTPETIAEAKTKVADGLNWWKETLAAVSPLMANDLNFHVDYTHADNPVRTHIEPINRRSDDFRFWMYDFLRVVDHADSGDFSSDIRAFNHTARVEAGAHWGFTIFVVNSTNDPEDAFAPGGSFARAFAYAGGRFMVVPSGRPTSTFAHEVGHMFWGRDEYLGEDWQARRGYYNTQNLNAARAGYTQLPSIMSSGGSLATAYDLNVSAPSTLAMIGWQDSDGDGIFDVLDVPLSLSGTGRYDAVAGVYRFRGQSEARTLPNRNSSGLQNDITINVVGRAEYRIDGGEWTTAATYGSYAASLDLSIAVPPDAQSIEIRTIDPDTGVTSAVFSGTLDRPLSHVEEGIQGFVFADRNTDATYANIESGWAGWTVDLVDNAGQPLVTQRVLEPDNHAELTSITNVLPGVQLSSIGWNSTGAVVSMGGDASTGSRGFGARTLSNQFSNWFTGDAIQLRIDFSNPTTWVGIDAIGVSGADFARLEAYDINGNLLSRTTTGPLAESEVVELSLARPQPDIAYVLVKGHMGTQIALDNLRVGPSSRATTDAQGSFHFAALPAGEYTLRVTPPEAWLPAGIVPANRSVTLGAGEVKVNVDFAVVGGLSDWHNPSNPLDVDRNGQVAPIDALIVINELNVGGARILSSLDPAPPLIDVNNDGSVSPVDALLVINWLNLLPSAAGERGGVTTGGGGGAVSGQGEDPTQRSTLDLRALLASSHRAEGHSPRGTGAPSRGNVELEVESHDSEQDPWMDALVRDVASRWLAGQPEDEHNHDHDDDDVVIDESGAVHDHAHHGHHHPVGCGCAACS